MYKFEVYKDAKGEYRWRFKAPNGQVMATSGEGYTTKQNCLDAIATIKKQASTASTVDLTLS